MPEHYLLGLVGHPLSHSLSPLLHNAALQFAGLSGQYRLFDLAPENFADELKQLLKSNLKGFNITIPYKQEIYKSLSQFTDEARLAGAVNTVKIESNHQLSGHNTDIIGFKLSLIEFFPEASPDKKVLLIGAGGAARAVIIALSQLGIKNIWIKTRNNEKAKAFIQSMNNQNPDLKIYDQEKNSLTEEIDLIVNASPIGLNNETTSPWLNQLMEQTNQNCLCLDLVYCKDQSLPAFCQLAHKNKRKTIDGLPMLIHQARFAFEFWTGIPVPAKIMYDALKTARQ